MTGYNSGKRIFLQGLSYRPSSLGIAHLFGYPFITFHFPVRNGLYYFPHISLERSIFGHSYMWSPKLFSKITVSLLILPEQLRDALSELYKANTTHNLILHCRKILQMTALLHAHRKSLF